MDNINDNSTLTDAINQLASKKKNVLTDEARRAADERDSSLPAYVPGDGKRRVQQTAVIESFNANVSLLISVFKKSKFDDVAVLLANPGRLILLNFVIGFIRGLGFVIALFFVAAVIVNLWFPGSLLALQQWVP